MNTATMRAARFDRASRQLTVQDVAVPEPGPGEVLVRVEACGICLSDVQRDIEKLVRLVASGRLDLSRSVSDLVPLEDVARGVERLRTKEGNPVRLVVKPRP
jgi:threonine dehydrogenase-like Zn-dependent dehydrogenase